MNYRQWKKNYKKQHGYNPPIEEDKRKRVKAQLSNYISYMDCLHDATQNIASALFAAMAGVCDALSGYFGTVGKSFSAAAEYYRGLAPAAALSTTQGTESDMYQKGEKWK